MNVRNASRIRSLFGPIASFSGALASSAALAMSGAAHAQSRAADTPNPLIPAGEEARMASHPIDPGHVAFKPGKGFVAKSTDGDFELSLGARAQFLYTVEKEEAVDTLQSLQIRRARVTSSGHFYGPTVKYKLELAVSPRDEAVADDGSPQTTELLDFYVDLNFARDASLRVGQYKVPFNRQRVISSGALQFVDRSITNAEFNIDRNIGVDLRSSDFLGLGALRYALGVYPARGRNSIEENDFDFLYLGRVEVLPLGLFEDYVEADFERTAPRLGLGASYAIIQDATRDRGVLGSIPADGGSTDLGVFQADLMFKAFGFSLLSEFFLRSGDRTPGSLVDDAGQPIAASPTRDGTGFLAQAGYLLPALPVEVAVRYARIDGSSDAGNDGLEDEKEIAAGLSYYVAHHQLKLQGDYTRLTTATFADGTDRFRLQLQAAF